MYTPGSKKKPVYSLMSSATLQSSKLPSGRKRRMMSGILRWESSFIAICSGSVSPSVGTSTGAFMLRLRSKIHIATMQTEHTHSPYL